MHLRYAHTVGYDLFCCCILKATVHPKILSSFTYGKCQFILHQQMPTNNNRHSNWVLSDQSASAGVSWGLFSPIEHVQVDFEHATF